MSGIKAWRLGKICAFKQGSEVHLGRCHVCERSPQPFRQLLTRCYFPVSCMKPSFSLSIAPVDPLPLSFLSLPLRALPPPTPNHQTQQTTYSSYNCPLNEQLFLLFCRIIYLYQVVVIQPFIARCRDRFTPKQGEPMDSGRSLIADGGQNIWSWIYWSTTAINLCFGQEYIR